MVVGSTTVNISPPGCTTSPPETLRFETMPLNGARICASASCFSCSVRRALASASCDCAATFCDRDDSRSRSAIAPALAESRSFRSRFRCATSAALCADVTADRADRYWSRIVRSSMRASSAPVATRLPSSTSVSQHRAADLRADRRLLRRLQVARDRRPTRKLGLRNDDDVLGADGRRRWRGFGLGVAGLATLATRERHRDQRQPRRLLRRRVMPR